MKRNLTYESQTLILLLPVLFKLKPDVADSQLSAWREEAKGLVGQIPGLLNIEVNRPLPITAERGQGFDFALVSTVESASDIPGYGAHPAHLK